MQSNTYCLEFVKNIKFSTIVLLIFFREKMAKDKFIPKASVGSDENKDISRGKFISVLSFGWLAFLAGLGGFFTALGRMFFPNVSFEPPQEFKIGFATDFEVGKVDLRFKKDYYVWVVRD